MEGFEEKGLKKMCGGEEGPCVRKEAFVKVGVGMEVGKDAIMNRKHMGKEVDKGLWWE